MKGSGRRMLLPQAILFDLDDTILDDSSSAESAWHLVCQQAAEQVDGLETEALLAAVSRVRRWFWSDAGRHRTGRLDLRAATRRIVLDALDSLGFADPGLAKTIAETYRDLREAAIRPFPGAIETLDQLRSAGVRTGLVTNGSRVAQRAKIERFDLEPRFDYILIEGEFGCGKPDERVYRAALDALGAQPDSAWMVGDNLEWDIAAPQRLGLRTVWVDAARTGLPAATTVQPDRVIHAIEELLPPPWAGLRPASTSGL